MHSSVQVLEVQYAIAPIVAAAIISGAAGAISSWWSNRRQEKMANRQSSTSYQRMVKDLNQAGLNPMLAYNQGHGEASVMPQRSDPLEGVSSSVVSAMLAKEQVKTLQSQQNANNSSAAKALAEADFTSFNTAKERTMWDIRKDPWTKMEVGRMGLEWDRLQAEVEQAKTVAERTAAETELKKLEAKINRLMMPEAEFGAERFKYIQGMGAPDWTKYVLPFLLKGGASASGIYRDLK